MTIPPRVAAFRETYRAEHIHSWYSGARHLAIPLAICLTTIGIGLWRIHDPVFLELLTVPVTFFIANMVEYWVHRHPMHRPMGPLAELYRRHTRQHHFFYTHEAMEAESRRDFHMVLFPAVTAAFFILFFVAPIGVAFFLMLTPNIGWLYIITVMAYFLTYELLHLAYHLPPQSAVGRLPGMASLRRHHTAHHDQQLMSSHNFNITFPIGDLVFGTIHVEQEAATEPIQVAG